jgi:hypothetical protein
VVPQSEQAMTIGLVTERAVAKASCHPIVHKGNSVGSP